MTRLEADIGRQLSLMITRFQQKPWQYISRYADTGTACTITMFHAHVEDSTRAPRAKIEGATFITMTGQALADT